MEREQQPKQIQLSKWNRTARECYLRGCMCQGCLLYELIFKNYSCGCQMKKTVLELVREGGIPEDLIRKQNII